MLVRASRCPGDTDIKSLANARIAYEYASSADGQSAPGKTTGSRLRRLPYELPQYALDALRLGLADAAIVDATTLRLYLGAQQRLEPFATNTSRSDPYAIAVRIDRADAWQLVDGALETLIERGELARIIDKWL